ncbi:MAG TPA: Holliday junction resolvase RuvX [Candidatus Pacebacteria bacterium]|nr:Holliday junction resolvase RuvX [Candidatus Paceibacterota bacterium]
MLLGLDWGQRKIGLSIAEEEIAIASTLATLENGDEIFKNLLDIVKEYEITRIVIGKSSHLSQDDNVKKIEKFASECKSKCGVEIAFEEEMFSTREAHETLKKVGKKRIGEQDDAEAARIILQQYLDANM